LLIEDAIKVEFVKVSFELSTIVIRSMVMLEESIVEFQFVELARLSLKLMFRQLIDG